MDSNLIRVSVPFTFEPNNYLITKSRKSNRLSLISQKKPFTLSFKLGNNKARNGVAFDESAYEAERLSMDAKARDLMAETSKRETESGAEDDPKSWKWIIRKRIWDLMEVQNIAQNPRPVHHRIPNFVGASVAAKNVVKRPSPDFYFSTLFYNIGVDAKFWSCSSTIRLSARSTQFGPEFLLAQLLYLFPAFTEQLTGLEEFRVAGCVKVNPDSPQKQVRLLTLSGGKKLLTPQPRLRTGFFSVLDSSMLSPSTINEACTSVGVAKYGKQIGLDEIIKVDLIVIGSVAVNPKTGARLGKGEGFAELEYGMLRYMGAIDDSTPVVTSVHDCQLVDDIPVEKLLIHDVPVDIICTPTQVIFTNTTIPKPQGIYWDKLSPEKLGQIRILRELKGRIEQETGKEQTYGPSEKLPPMAKRRR